MTPDREKFRQLLSPFIDGELSPSDRRWVEAYIADNPGAAADVAELRSTVAEISASFAQQAEAVDWEAFTESVMRGLPSIQVSRWERLRSSLSQMWSWQRGAVLAGAVGAGVALAVAVPLTLNHVGPKGYGASKLEIQNVSVDSPASVSPLVTKTEDGDAVIWMVEDPVDAGIPDKGPKAFEKEL